MMTLDTLQAPGQLARALRSLRNPQQAPLRFALQTHNERVRYADAPTAEAPPVLLLSPSPALVRQLQVPPPDAPPSRAGRLITGLILTLGGQQVVATAQRIRPRLLAQSIHRLADLAGVPRPSLRVQTHHSGQGILATVKAAQAAGRVQAPVGCWIQPGPPPALRLPAADPAPIGWISATLAREGSTLWLDTPAGIERAHQARAALRVLARACGVARLRKVVARYGYGPGGPYRYALPAPRADARLARVMAQEKVGFHIQREEANTITASGASPTYGELKPDGIARIFSVQDVRGRAFLDMGSGTGRAVLAAGLGYPLSRAHGIELSQTRLEIGRAALAALRQQTGRAWPRIQLYAGDMLAFDVRQYDIIFISNLCFGPDFNQKLAEKFDRELRSGTHVFSSKAIRGHRSTSLQKVDGVPMSWSPRSSLYHSRWD